MFQNDTEHRIAIEKAKAMAAFVADVKRGSLPFWQQDWKKLRRRAWKHRRSAGLHR